MRLLIVRSCAVGDFVLNLPAIRALALAYPGARFTLVGNPGTLALARTFVEVEAIHSMDSRPWANLFVGPLPDLGGYDAAWVWMKDATVAENLQRSGISKVFHAEAFPATGHAAAHLLSTIHLPAPELPDLWDSQSQRIILHPGSGGAFKVWPHFTALAAALPSAAVLLGPADAPLDTANPRIENLALTDVAELLRQCRIFVGSDSGITHLAAYWGAPTVALFGPTDPQIWGPIGRRVIILRKPALADITVDEVLRLL